MKSAKSQKIILQMFNLGTINTSIKKYHHPIPILFIVIITIKPR